VSYYDVADQDYHELPAGTPGWQDAPVPGWGANPFRAGPVRVGVGQDEYDEYEPVPETPMKTKVIRGVVIGLVAWVALSYWEDRRQIAYGKRPLVPGKFYEDLTLLPMQVLHGTHSTPGLIS